MLTTGRFLPSDRLLTFGVVWCGQLISLIGSGLTSFALGVWVYQQTGSVAQFALLSLFAVVPGIVFSPFAGVFVDRADRRWAMIGSDIGAGLATFTIWFFVMAGQFEIWYLYLPLAFSSACSTLRWPAYYAATTLLVPKKHYGRVAGLVELGPAAAQVLSPILAGTLVMTIGLPGVLLMDLVTFAFAVLTLLVIQFPAPEALAVKQSEKGSLWQDAAYGWNYIKARPGLLGLLLVFAVINLIIGLVVILIVPLVLSFSNASVLGIILSIAGGGMVLGQVALSVWGGPTRRIRGVVDFTLLSGAMLILGGWQANLSLIGLSAFVFLFSTAMIGGCSQAIWQSKVAPEIQGRVFAVRRMIALSSAPIARLLVGPLADNLFEPWLAVGGPLATNVGQIVGSGPGRGIGFLFIVLGVMTTAAGLVAYAYPRIRGVEDELADHIPDNVVLG